MFHFGGMQLTKVHIGVTAGAVSAASLYFIWKWYSKREVIPTEWRQVGVIGDLMCFPIKSCGVLRVNTMECTKLGPRTGILRDREFMVTKANGDFVSARIHPQLIVIQPKLTDDVVTLTAPNMEPLVLKLNELSEKSSIKTTLWGQPINSVDCGDEAAKWMSKFILNQDTGLRLVHFSSNFNTQKISRLREIVNHDDSGIYPDLTSYNLINESSIDDLNTRMNGFKTDAQTFRPNFVVKGAKAYEEDEWKWMRIGEVVFKVVKYCTRCNLTTVDWRRGVKNENGEPLATLRKYRMIGVLKHDKNSPIMGIHLTIRKEGYVNLSDPVFVA